MNRRLKPIRFASVCDGISAVGVAWKSLQMVTGEPAPWQFVFKSEIEPFPSAVADLHHPEAPNLGDMTQHKNWSTKDYGIDLICGGTPCQAFSVAGLRKGLADPRGNLTLTYLAVIAQFRPRWVVWENVPGVLSDQTGAFGSFLGGLGQLGYGFAYRILDAQYFGVAQRRRRVFVVGHIGGLWQRAAAVLFERDCLSGNPAPRRQPGQGATYDAAPCLGASGRGVERAGETRGQDPVIAFPSETSGTQSAAAENISPNLKQGPTAIAFNAKDSGADEGELSPTLRAGNHDKSHANSGNWVGVVHALRGEGFDASEDGTGRGTPLVPEVYGTLREHVRNNSNPVTEAAALIPTVLAHGQASAERVSDGSPSLTCNHEAPIAFLPFDTTQITSPENGCNPKPGAPCHPLAAGAHAPAVASPLAVRRLTPRECERLQGFPDDYTLIQFKGKPAADGPRYKALGNSMAVPVMRWIGERIQMVEQLCPL